MITMQDILQRVSEQALSSNCSADSLWAQLTLEKYTTSEHIQKRITYANGCEAFKGLPIHYIEYDSLENEFIFRIQKFNKENGQITSAETAPCSVKWINTIKNEYVLMCSSTDNVGLVLRHQLPVIYKN